MTGGAEVDETGLDQTGADETGVDETGVDEPETGVRLEVDAVDDPVAHLLRGEIDVEGRMPYSSNATFLVHVEHDGARHPAIYKPLRGERPLWDFEPGLHRREVAAYLLSETIGAHVVPPTVLRDGPLGEGSLQWFVVGDHSEHYFTIHESRPGTHDQLRAIAALDILANNTDRKSGHCLLAPGTDDGRVDDDGPVDHEGPIGHEGPVGHEEIDGHSRSSVGGDRVWAIDHGLCFAPEFKLRTVIWEFGDEPLPEWFLDAAARLCQRIPLDIAALLGDDEVEAIQGRAAWCVKERRFPTDPTGRRYPWPLV